MPAVPQPLLQSPRQALRRARLPGRAPKATCRTRPTIRLCPDRQARCNRLECVTISLGGKLPDILTLVEHIGSLHMVGAVCLRLCGKQSFGITHVSSDIGRHLAHIQEKLGKHRSIRSYDRIVGLHHLEPDRSVVCVYDVFDPAVVGENRIRIVVVGQKRCKLTSPVEDIAVKHDAGFVVEIR